MSSRQGLWRQSKNRLKNSLKNATRRVSGEKKEGGEGKLEMDGVKMTMTTATTPMTTPATTSDIAPSNSSETFSPMVSPLSAKQKKKKIKNKNKNKNKNKKSKNSKKPNESIIIVCASPIEILDELTFDSNIPMNKSLTKSTKNRDSFISTINIKQLERSNKLLPLDWYSPRAELLDEKRRQLRNQHSLLDVDDDSDEFSWHKMSDLEDPESQSNHSLNDSQNYNHRFSYNEEASYISRDSQMTEVDDGLTEWGLPKVLLPEPVITCWRSLVRTQSLTHSLTEHVAPSLSHSRSTLPSESENGDDKTHADDTDDKNDITSQREAEFYRDMVIRSSTFSSGLTLTNNKYSSPAISIADSPLKQVMPSVSNSTRAATITPDCYEECVDLLITPVSPQISLLALRKRVGVVVTIVYFAVLLSKIPSLRSKLQQTLCPVGGYRKRYYHRRNISSGRRAVYLPKQFPPITNVFPDWGF